MDNRKIIVAQSDVKIIWALLNRINYADAVNTACYNKLREELNAATIVTDDEMPEEVIRIQSWFDVETSFGKIYDYQLVVPSRSNRYQKKLSILTPMGSALFGRALGDEILWNFPSGESKISIKNVRQIQHESEDTKKTA